MTRRSPSRIRDVFRTLRPTQGMTQQQVEELSEELPVPISREFVAGLEVNGLPGTVKKFLTYAWLTRADLDVLTELVALQESLEKPALPPREAVDKTRELSERGRHREALSVAIAAARRATGPEVGGLLLTAAIAAKCGGYWTLSRSLAEQALCSAEIRPDHFARAALVAASAADFFGLSALALHYQKLIEPELLAGDPSLSASYWHNVAVLRRSIGDHELALEATANASKYYEQLGTSGEHAVLVSVRAGLVSDAGDASQALELASMAVELLEETGDTGSNARRVYLNAGKVALAANKKWLARQHLLEARDLAISSVHDQDLFECQLYLCSLAQAGGHKNEANRLYEILKKDAPRFRLDRRTREDFRRITRQHDYGWEECEVSKTLVVCGGPRPLVAAPAIARDSTAVGSRAHLAMTPEFPG